MLLLTLPGGADQQTLLHLYRSLIRSKLDYGCIVYGSARPSCLRILDPVRGRALRLCLGAFGASPAVSLCVGAAGPPLAVRRRGLSLQCCLKLGAGTDNPACSAVFGSGFEARFDRKPSRARPLGFGVAGDFQTLGFNGKGVLPTAVPSVPPWLLQRPTCNFSLCCCGGTAAGPEVFKCKFFELRSEFSQHLEIYTDGSKDGVRTAAAVVAPNSVKTVCLPDNASIFTAELHVLDMALGIILRTRSKDYVVYSDSLSSLKATDSCKVEKH